MPKISIVLPTYNGEKYIKESIDSIINQTFRDWELIIVNDCSTDHTLQIIEEYKKKDRRIQIISNKENRKLPCSLNIGFKKAKGEYLTWTSDDNMYSPHALEKMLFHLEKDCSIYMVCSGMELIDSQGNKIGIHKKYDEIDMYRNDCVGACFMYRHSIIDRIGEYDETRFCVEDYAYWLRILKEYGHIEWIDEILYSYRIHENSLTKRKKDFIHRQLLMLRVENIDFILEKLKNHPELITRMYCEFIKSGFENFFYIKAVHYVPELSIIYNNIQSYENLKNIVIWGAGDYGHRALDKFKNNVVAFADKREELVGTRINNIIVISINELLDNADKYNICIAVSDEKIYEILKIIYSSGIKKCRIIQDFL